MSATSERPVLPQRFILDNKRRRIIDGIGTLFAERSDIHEVKIADIVKAGGVARKTFYDIFDGKDDALAQALKCFGDDLRHAIEKATAPRDTVGLKVEAGLSALCLWFDDHRGAGLTLLVHAPAISLDIDHALRERFAEMVSTDGLVGPFEEMLVGAVVTPLMPRLLAGEPTLPVLPDLRDLILTCLQVEESSGGGVSHA